MFEYHSVELLGYAQVLDWSRVLANPYCTAMMIDMEASFVTGITLQLYDN